MVITSPKVEAINIRSAQDPELEKVKELLKEVGLPREGVEEQFNHYLLTEMEGTIVGVAGLEIYGEQALLRSVAVKPEYQGRGIGSSLVSEMINRARLKGIRTVYLLTVGAEGFFAKMGFQPLSWDEVGGEVKRSCQFQWLCPKSATAMRLTLRPVG